MKFFKIKDIFSLVYPIRILGVTFIGVAITLSLIYFDGREISYWYLIVPVIWPHIAQVLTINSKKPKKQEYRNFLVDSLISGGFSNLFSFSLWPALTLIGMASINGLTMGGILFFVKSFVAIGLGYLAIGFFNGFAFIPDTSLESSLISFGFISVYVGFIALLNYLNGSRALKMSKQFKLANQEIAAKNQQLEKVATQLSKYLSPQVYNMIFTGEKEVKIESSRKKLTIFFSDIIGFTDASDRMESEELTKLLNNYLNEMSKIALEYGGTIDKYIGDSIMIFFGDPESMGEKEDALRCVRMAIAMREHMESLRQKWYDEGITNLLHLRMGITTGFCTIGNFGSDDRMDYTIIGSQVNLANRLESQAEKDQILVSSETYLLIKDEILCQPKDELTVKGFAYPIQTYQIVNYHHKNTLANDLISISDKGFDLNVNLNKIERQKAIRLLKKVLNNIDKL